MTMIRNENDATNRMLRIPVVVDQCHKLYAATSLTVDVVVVITAVDAVIFLKSGIQICPHTKQERVKNRKLK
jgi:hypothetical protein